MLCCTTRRSSIILCPHRERITPRWYWRARASTWSPRGSIPFSLPPSRPFTLRLASTLSPYRTILYWAKGRASIWWTACSSHCFTRTDGRLWALQLLRPLPWPHWSRWRARKPTICSANTFNDATHHLKWPRRKMNQANVLRNQKRWQIKSN